MKTFVHIVILIIGISSLLSAEDRWSFYTNSSGHSLKYEEVDGKKIPFMTYFMKHQDISDEVKIQFKKDYPALWAVALKSSGNMHNPKIIPLIGKFSEVLLKTPTLKKLDKLARVSGYTISGASHEKFHFVKKGDKMKVFAHVWLEFKQVVKTDLQNNAQQTIPDTPPAK